VTAYWITNPDNVFIDNVAAGSDENGFWWSLDLTAYKNRNGGAWSRGELHVYKNFKAADNNLRVQISRSARTSTTTIAMTWSTRHS
jgi:hypothetical protein